MERAIVELACQEFVDPWKTKLEFCIFEQGKFIASGSAATFLRVIIRCILFCMKAAESPIFGRSSKIQTSTMPVPVS